MHYLFINLGKVVTYFVIIYLDAFTLADFKFGNFINYSEIFPTGKKL